MTFKKTDHQMPHHQLLPLSQGAFVLALQMLGQHQDAEDAVQTSILKSLEQPSIPSAPEELKRWFYRVVRNTALDKLRKRHRHSEQNADSELLEDLPGPSYIQPEQHLEQQQLKDQLQSALAALPWQQRELIVLRDYHHYSYCDIAEIINAPEGTVMSRLHRARLALRELLLSQHANTQATDTNQRS